MGSNAGSGWHRLALMWHFRDLADELQLDPTLPCRTWSLKQAGEWIELIASMHLEIFQASRLPFSFSVV